MTFGANFYIPVLKLKRGEKKALRLLAPAVRARLLPLLEIVERTAPGQPPPSLATHLTRAFDQLALAVGPLHRYFLDCREIAPDGPAAAADVFTRAAALPTPFTPVTGISRVIDVPAVMAHRRHGVAIRLTRYEFEAGQIPTGLPAFIRTHSLTPEETDLIVDIGAVDDMIAAGVETLTAAFLADVPDHRRWRTLTVSGCAFPQSMGGVDANSADLVDRAEWRAWRDGLYVNRGQLARLPTFSDGAIQHPSGVEGFDPRIMAASASIRIAQSDQWLLVKGVSTRNVPAKDQFPSLARQLVYGNLRGYFAGAAHCAGCAKMMDAANGAPNLGSPEAWRRLGTIHHLTRAVELISGLTWP
jgi:hypothetical protein